MVSENHGLIREGEVYNRRAITLSRSDPSWDPIRVYDLESILIEPLLQLGTPARWGSAWEGPPVCMGVKVPDQDRWSQFVYLVSQEVMKVMSTP